MNAVTTKLRLIFSWPWSAGIAVTCVMIASVHISLQRTHFGIGAESDFTTIFGRDAQRILLGEPLRLDFHPPGYSFAAAFGRLTTGDWLVGALWVSGIAALVVLISSLVTFRRVAGTAAAWGSLVACACSTLFLRFASTASSDMMFAALVYLMFALMVLALDRPGRRQYWLISGVVAGCVLLTRANGIAAAVILLAPLLGTAAVTERWRNLLALASGFVLPLVVWTVYANATASPLLPAGNHLNLAVAAFGDESAPWGDQAAQLQSSFGSIFDVLAHDPVRLASNLGRRFLSLPGALFHSLTWPLVIVMAVPGVLLMIWRRRSPAFLLILAALTGLTLINALNDFGGRYHLVLIPFIGAMAGVTAQCILERLPDKPGLRAGFIAVVLIAAVLMAWKAKVRVLPLIETTVQLELAEAVPYVLHHTETDAVIFARKANLGFETGRQTRILGDISSITQLHRELCSALGQTDPAYLYVGTMERAYRGELTRELAGEAIPPWLRRVAGGPGADWTLYRIAIYDPSLTQDGLCPTASGDEIRTVPSPDQES